MEVIYDTSYVSTRLIGLWKRISITLIVLVISILLYLAADASASFS